MNNKNTNLLYIVMFLLIINLVVGIVILSKIGNINVKDSSESQLNESLITLTPKAILEKINNKEEIVLYIGQDDCKYCKEMLPNIYKAQTVYNFNTVYLNISKNSNSSEFNELMNKLDVEITANINGEQKTQAFGKFNVTPMIAVIRNGKMVNGLIGSNTYDKYESFLLGAGITKN